MRLKTPEEISKIVSVRLFPVGTKSTARIHKDYIKLCHIKSKPEASVPVGRQSYWCDVERLESAWQWLEKNRINDNLVRVCKMHYRGIGNGDRAIYLKPYSRLEKLTAHLEGFKDLVDESKDKWVDSIIDVILQSLDPYMKEEKEEDNTIKLT